MLTTFKEMKRRVQQRLLNDCTSTADSINDLLPKLGVWINERYERIWEAKPWQQKIKNSTLTIVASQKQYVLPRDFGQMMTVFDQTNGKPIKEGSIQEHIRFRAGALDQASNIQTGDPVRFYPIGTYTVKAELSQAEKISIVSSDAADVSPLVVRIVGEVSSTEVAENKVITGTTSVDSGNTYDSGQKLHISIGTNDGSTPSITGVITVTGATSGDTLAVISSFDLATPYQWIEVSPTPKASGTQPTWSLWYRKRFRELVDDNDMPQLDCCQAIIIGAYSDGLREDGQEAQADSADVKFTGLVEELWASQNSGDKIEQFIPMSGEMVTIDEFGRQIYADIY